MESKEQNDEKWDELYPQLDKNTPEIYKFPKSSYQKSTINYKKVIHNFFSNPQISEPLPTY